jgi:acyl transferase domain-containing protein/acyl carrier protein
LTGEGFDQLAFPAEAMHGLGQQVIVGVSDGCVRQRQQGVEAMPIVPQREKNPAPVSQGDSAVPVEMYVRKTILDELSEALKLDRNEIDQDMPFASYGLDSIMAVRMIDQINLTLGTALSSTSVFDYSTTAKLACHIVDRYGSKLAEKIQKLHVVEPFAIDDRITMAVRKRSAETRYFASSQLSAASSSTASRPAGEETAHVEEPIAIIGMAGRFPAARDIDAMWSILEQGMEVVGQVPRERAGEWRDVAYRAGFVPGVSEFDPLFFKISQSEAEAMDPRQRLLLQEAWHALEHAGYGPRQLASGRLGTFVGVEEGDYAQVTRGMGGITANHNGILASRLAYFLDATGPVMAINTACASGLVAAHQACMSLRAGECDTAIAAGVALMLTPSACDGMQAAGMLSEDGRCYAFDARANGMVPAEAVAVLVFKRLSRALADGDTVYATIRGSGLNYDGKTNGITAPSGVAQSALLRDVYDRYRIDPEQIGHIVTHGTGTRLGDPIEINALDDAFKRYTAKQGYCALTSTKTNFGHSLAASGLVSLIGLTQAIRHATIPASLHCEQESDYINWAESPFYVNKTTRTWPAPAGHPRTGAVSAFGMSGTNVHMVVQEHAQPVRGAAQPGYLFALSARTEEALGERVAGLVEVLQARSWTGAELACMSYTLLEGRHHFDHRCAVVAGSAEEAVAALGGPGCEGIGGQRFAGVVPRNWMPEAAVLSKAQALVTQTGGEPLSGAAHRGNLVRLAELYCQGYALNWDGLFVGERPGRIGLPGYPFAREHHWLGERGRDAGAAAAERKPFDAGLFDRLLDDVIDGVTSVDEAVLQALA